MIVTEDTVKNCMKKYKNLLGEENVHNPIGVMIKNTYIRQISKT